MTWVERFPSVGSGLVSYEDSVSPQFHELEREAVFRRSWLMVGRDIHLNAPGRYFTKEMEVLKTSILVVRGRDGRIRSFHNVCPHRGNKLVWESHPRKEVQGRCMRFMCKYHGLTFGLEGQLEVLPDPEAWFGDEGRNLRLAEIPTEVWKGFIFVNLTPGGPKETLQQFLGEPYWSGFDGYPFEAFTEHVSLRGSCRSNWKTLADAFAEGWHVITLHAASFPSLSKAGPKPVMRSLDYATYGKHRYNLTARIPDGFFNARMDAAAKATGAGPRYHFPMDVTQLPHGANPISSDVWGTSAHGMWPNWTFQIYYPGWFLTYSYWPIAYNEMRFEIDWYLPPPRNFSELLSQKTSVSLFMDAALQDINTLEATQIGLESGAFSRYPLTDEEFMVRHLHKVINEEVERFQAEQANTGANR